jgi:outer membrane receptor protein involved in Fe transport
MKKINTRKVLVSAVALALASTVANAQPVLEEVIVTATKREVGLQDVPVAITVVTGEKILEQGVTSLEQLALFIPNVQITEAGGGDQLFIRGVGSGVNYGFEQSVGTIIDGVYFGRGQASRSAFLDIERVEVLKGPQSTIFGKNTIAGAINITSAGPTDEFEAMIEGTNEFEFDHWSTTFMVSGPLTDTLQGRVVVKRDETDGYMDNTFLDQDEVKGSDTVGRVMLDWYATDELSARFKYEAGESHRKGRQNMISVAADDAIALYQAADPDFTPSFGYDKSMENVGGVRPDSDTHDSDWDIGTMTLEWAMDAHTLKSITGYIDYSFDNYLDVDFGPLQVLGRGRDEHHKQYSQEFLLSSELGSTLEYLAGLYYQKEDLHHGRYTDAILSGAGIGTGSLDGTSTGSFEQDAESWSAFVQLTWDMSDSFRVIGGLRYSDDEKEFKKKLYTATPFTDTPNNVLAGISDQILNLTTDHSFDSSGATVCKTVAYVCTFYPDFSNERSEQHLTGDITLQWDASDSIMTYAKAGNGYKAGGFDEDNSRGSMETAEYEDETVISYELGAKMEAWDGRGRLNVSLFYSEFDDVQVSTFDGNVGFNVGNAAEAESKGIELDGMFAVTENLTVSGALAYLKAEYKSFDNAACNESQILDLIAAGGVRSACTQDLAGKPLQYSPEWSAHLAADYFISLGENLEMRLGLDAMYSDEYVIPLDQDEVLSQEAYWKFNARVQIAGTDDTWSLALLGKNLTNEETTAYGNDVPLAAQGFSSTYYQHIDPPRSYELQVRYNF